MSTYKLASPASKYAAFIVPQKQQIGYAVPLGKNALSVLTNVSTDKLQFLTSAFENFNKAHKCTNNDAQDLTSLYETEK